MATACFTVVKRVYRAALVCTLLLFAAVLVQAQPHHSYPAFTLTIETTAYDANGNAISSSRATRYDSSSGDWRYAWMVDGHEQATIYRRGAGVYHYDARIGITLKVSNFAGGCPRWTAEQMQNELKFVPGEVVLGLQTYVKSQRLEPMRYRIETFYTEELGGIPFKRIYYYDDGRRIVEQPINLIFGEPAVADVRGPEYPVVEQLACQTDLKDNIITQPDPEFAPDTDSGGFGNKVFVGVIIDETGRVIHASANTSIVFLRDPAVAAAYKATFTPVLKNGVPVKARGLLRYKFVSPQLAKN